MVSMVDAKEEAIKKKKLMQTFINASVLEMLLILFNFI